MKLLTQAERLLLKLAETFDLPIAIHGRDESRIVCDRNWHHAILRSGRVVRNIDPCPGEMCPARRRIVAPDDVGRIVMPHPARMAR